jgi:hypothetical protein
LHTMLMRIVYNPKITQKSRESPTIPAHSPKKAELPLSLAHFGRLAPTSRKRL